MPTYDYRCAKCGETIEVWQSFSDAPLTKHEGCGGALSKVLGAAGIVLKGSGFYKNDSGSRSKGARKEKKEPVEAGSSKSSDSSGPGTDSGSAGSSGAEKSTSSSSGSDPGSTSTPDKSSTAGSASGSDKKSA